METQTIQTLPIPSIEDDGSDRYRSPRRLKHPALASAIDHWRTGMELLRYSVGRAATLNVGDRHWARCGRGEWDHFAVWMARMDRTRARSDHRLRAFFRLPYLLRITLSPH